MDIPAAVVLAADSNGLGALRSLVRQQVPTWVLVTSPAEIARSSRHANRVLQAASAEDTAILAALRQAPDGSVLIPTSDRFVSFISRNDPELAMRFSWCRLPGDLADLLIDKAQEVAMVRSLGIPLPKTVLPASDPDGQAACALRFPVIVKPRSFKYHGTLARKNLIVASAPDLLVLLQRLGDGRDGILIQEVIPGDDDMLWVCNATFGPDHLLLGAVTFQRLGTSPAHFGVTSFARARHNPKVLDHVRALGLGLRYVGPAMVEFKQDPRDGAYYYIETNPRLGMCNWFDTQAGVNNAWLSYRVAVGRELPPSIPRQLDDVGYLSVLEDWYARRKIGWSALAILRHWIALRQPRMVGPYFDWSDPWPGIVMAWRRVLDLAHAVLRRLRLLPGRGRKY